MLDQSDGKQVAFNLSVATVIKTGGGRVVNACVITAGAIGALHDCATTGAASAANQIAVTPATAGNYSINMPFQLGLVYVPGAAQVAAISFN
jgi:hypothetical protein